MTVTSGKSSHGDSLLSQSVCRCVGGDVIFFRDFKDLQESLVDGIQFFEHRRLIPAQNFNTATIDDAAGISSIVGCVQDAALLQVLAMTRLEQLIVGSPAHDL